MSDLSIITDLSNIFIISDIFVIKLLHSLQGYKSQVFQSIC